MLGTLSQKFRRARVVELVCVSARIAAQTAVVAVSRESVTAKFVLATAASLIRQVARLVAAKVQLQPR